jgi:membrane protein
VWWLILKESAVGWSDHKDSRQGAALAYYSVFSLGPIIVIAIAVAGFFFGHEAVTGQVAASIEGLLGKTGAQAVQAMLADAGRPREGSIASAVGLVVLLFAAIGVVVQLKDALNTVWEVEDKSPQGFWHFIRSYVISLAAVMALGFLLLVSLAVTAGVASFSKYASAYVSEGSLHLLSSVISLAVITVMFAMMFKLLPDAPVDWYDVWVGAFLTALMFEIGKVAIAFYIGKQGFESTYGATASIIVVLIWVYYTSQIILMGAEVTHAFAKQHGSLKIDKSASSYAKDIRSGTT